METAPKPESKWAPILQTALAGIIGGKDLAGLQGLEKALASLVFAVLDIWSKQPESEASKAVEALFAALRDDKEPAVQAMSVMDRFAMRQVLSLLSKSRGAI